MHQRYDGDPAAFEKEFKRAIELDPSALDVRGHCSWFLPAPGRNDEAIEQARLLGKVASTSTGGNGNLGSGLVFALPLGRGD